MANKKSVCIKCGSPMKKGWCIDETCPFSDSVRKREWLAYCKAVNTIEPHPIHVPGFNPPVPNMNDPKTAAKVKAFIERRKAFNKKQNEKVHRALCIEELEEAIRGLPALGTLSAKVHIKAVIKRLKKGA